ncbi:type IV secretory system conjugative DNA transfer family protein, partial [Pseudomonas sp. HMSC066A08]
LVDDPDGDPKALAGLFDEMREVSINDGDPANREAQLVITGVGTRMANTPARELGSIISTANNALALYRDPIVGENTSRNDFKIADLMDHDRPVSLYLIS